MHMGTKTLDIKLKKILSGDRRPENFIIADAKDSDMARGINSAGFGSDGKFRNQRTYRQMMREVVKQGIVDIMLMSASNLEVLSREGIFENSPVTPAARANDTTDIWVARKSEYANLPSKPFASASIDSILGAGADLGLYSMTFNNILERDLESIERFADFRRACAEKGFRYFLEVFNPNSPQGIAESDIPAYVNDCIVRSLAGVVESQRPLFLKVAYNGPKAMEELATYDDRIIVGILGGSSGSTLDAFALLHEAQKYGAMVALFGRKINDAQSPLHFLESMRAVSDSLVSPREGVKLYHDKMKKAGIVPVVSLEDDLILSAKLQQHY